MSDKALATKSRHGFSEKELKNWKRQFKGSNTMKKVVSCIVNNSHAQPVFRHAQQKTPIEKQL